MRDSTGNLVQGAQVALIPSGTGSASGLEVSDVSGTFCVRARPGSYYLTATALGNEAAYAGPLVVADGAATAPQTLLMGKRGFVVSGRITDRADAPVPRVLVRLVRLSSDEGDVFYARADANGHYQAQVASGYRYAVSVSADDLVSRSTLVSGENRTNDITVSVRGPAPEFVVAWLEESAVPLRTAQPSDDVSDLAGLAAAIGDARVVALGEATHGTREFFQLKHRVLQYLVEELGFRVFAIEANFTEALAINEYVLGKKGDPDALLSALRVWPWCTEEVAAQIDWMRSYNASHRDPVKFYGFDMQWADNGVKAVVDYLRRVDPQRAKIVDRVLAPMVSATFSSEYAKLPTEERHALAKEVADLIAGFDAKRRRYVRRAGLASFELARQNAVVVQQTERLAAAAAAPEHGGLAGRNARDARDAAMATNALWVLNREPSTRMVLWAHNIHIARGDYSFDNMGSYLARRLGRDYVAIGFAFGHGDFQAIGSGVEKRHASGPLLRAFDVGRAPEDHLEAALARVSHPMFAVDLRTAPIGAVREWLGGPQPLRETGALFSSEEQMTQVGAVSARYDLLIYVDQTTRARPVGHWRGRSDL